MDRRKSGIIAQMESGKKKEEGRRRRKKEEESGNVEQWKMHRRKMCNAESAQKEEEEKENGNVEQWIVQDGKKKKDGTAERRKSAQKKDGTAEDLNKSLNFLFFPVAKW